jgi:flagellar motor switch protein FliG
MEQSMDETYSSSINSAEKISLSDAVKQGIKQSNTSSVAAIMGVKEVDGSAKVATILLTVGPEIAAEVLRQLTPFEVQHLSAKMASIRALDRDVVINVLREFKDLTFNHAQISLDTEAFMQNMLKRVLGAGGAADLLGRLGSSVNLDGIEALSLVQPQVIYDIVKDEHPQIVATLFTFLEPGQASALAALFPEDQRNELMLRVALLDKVDPAALQELNEVMQQSVGPESKKSNTGLGGVVPAAEILNLMTGQMDQRALDGIRSYDSELADSIAEKMFVFEDFLDVDDRSIQLLLQEIPQDVMIVSLKGASPKLRDKMFKNMTRRNADRIRDELDAMPPVKVIDVEQQQKEMIKVARKMASDQKIVLERVKQFGSLS